MIKEIVVDSKEDLKALEETLLLWGWICHKERENLVTCIKRVDHESYRTVVISVRKHGENKG